jgi:hypothetical protein
MADSTVTLRPRALTSDQKKAAEAAFRGLPCNPEWSASAGAVYDGLVTALRGKPVQDQTNELLPSRPQYTLGYGLRLDTGIAPEQAHPDVQIRLPDGSQGRMTLHVINGTREDIKARLLERVDALFDHDADSELNIP